MAKYCPTQFLDYHKCLGQGDASKCLEQQENLSTCVKTKVPSFIKILKDCEKPMKAYEECVTNNPQMRSKCFDLLQEMRQCSANSIGAKAKE